MNKQELLNNYYTAKFNELCADKDAFNDFIEKSSNLYRHTLDNQIAIIAQHDNPTACVSYDAWNKLGYYVTRGSKGILTYSVGKGKDSVGYVFDIKDVRGTKHAQKLSNWDFKKVALSQIDALFKEHFRVEGNPHKLTELLIEIAYKYVVEAANDKGFNVAAMDEEITFATKCLSINTLRRIKNINSSVELPFDGDAERIMNALSIFSSAQKNLFIELASLAKEMNLESAVKPSKEVNNPAFKESIPEANQSGEQISFFPSQEQQKQAIESAYTIDDPIDVVAEKPISPTVTYYVAECGEFHSLGEFRDNIKTIEEALQVYESISAKSVMAGIPSIGCKLHYPGPNTFDSEFDFVYGKTIDLHILKDYNELFENNTVLNALHYLISSNKFSINVPSDLNYLVEGEGAEPTKNIPSVLPEDEFGNSRLATILRTGGNQSDSKARIYAKYQAGYSEEEIVNFLKKEYGTTGKGFTFDGKDYAVWFDESGMTVSEGHSALLSKALIKYDWHKIEHYIREIIEDGSYMTAKQVEEIDVIERSRIASELYFFFRDGIDEFPESIPELWREKKDNGLTYSVDYPSAVEALMNALATPQGRRNLTLELTKAKDAIDSGEKEIAWYYNEPKYFINALADLDRPKVEYDILPDELVPIEQEETFITDDEVDEFLIRRGSGVQGGKLRIYDFFNANLDAKERTAFLSKEFGIGGSSHAFSNRDNAHDDHDGKGLRFSKGSIMEPFATLTLSWDKVAKRIANLIETDRFLTEKEKEAINWAAPEESSEIEETVNDEAASFVALGQEITAELNKDNNLSLEEMVEKQAEPTFAERKVEFSIFNEQNSKEDFISAINENKTIYLYQKREQENHLGDVWYPVYNANDKTFVNLSLKYDNASGKYIMWGSLADSPSQEPCQLRIFDADSPEAIENIIKALEAAEIVVDSIAQESELDRALRYINDYYQNEFDSPVGIDMNATEGFDDLADVGLAYTTIDNEHLVEKYGFPKYKEFEIQVSANLLTNEITVYIDGDSIRVDKYDSLEAMNNAVLSQLDFGELIWLEDEDWQKLADREIDKEAERAINEGEALAIGFKIPQDVEEEIDENFVFADEEEITVNGKKSRIAANIKALELIRELERLDRKATDAEKLILARYSGWGGLSEVFEYSYRINEDFSYKEERDILSGLLTDAEWKAARESSLTAYYTPKAIIDAMYSTISRFGFSSGKILEPCCGVGNFIGASPYGRHAKFTAVEKDLISGKIAKYLYPESRVIVTGYEETKIKNESFDVAIGNVPFGNFSIWDKEYPGGKLIHDYFFTKSLDKVKDGGVVAFISSSGTLDKLNAAARIELSEKADFIGAVRLPNNVFKNADVTTDIIFLKKNWNEEKAVINNEWLTVSPYGNTECNINDYFKAHPENIVGEIVETTNQFGKTLTCEYHGDNFVKDLRKALSNINCNIETKDINEIGDNNSLLLAEAVEGIQPFTFGLYDDKAYYNNNGELEAVSEAQQKRVKALISLNETVRNIITLQNDNCSDEDFEIAKNVLNQEYDDFVEKFGRINSKNNAKAFEKDSSYYLLCSLENIDSEGEFISKSDIFSKRTIKRNNVITHCDSCAEALSVTLDQTGYVCMERMMQLTEKTEAEVYKELEGIIYYTGSEEIQKAYQTADEFLSGNVRNKLETYQNLVEMYEKKGDEMSASEQHLLDVWKKNVAALAEIQPTLLSASEIDIRLGATWIPIPVIQRFLNETFELSAWANIEVEYAPTVSTWHITNKSSVSYSNINATTTYGIDEANGLVLLEDCLNLKNHIVYDKYIDSEGNEKRKQNKEKTMLAQQKQELLRDKFREWIYEDQNRREALVALYNKKFNSIRPREYDGSHLTFAGMNSDITLKGYQKNAIARCLYGGNTLLAHAVGAGKTFEMATTAMESKRLGLCNKSLFVVPNHLVGQWAEEFYRLYPNAKILASKKEDFTPANRKIFCSRIATGDYDAVIIGHSQFEKLPLSAKRQKAYIEQEIEQYEDALSEYNATKDRWSKKSYTIRQIELSKKNLEKKLAKLSDSEKDDVITFEELGIDKLFVDEAHYYKNLQLATKMSNVAGVQTTESKRAFDMFQKVKYLDEQTNGKGVVFATGTPISNSVTELYTMMRYLQRSKLADMGFSFFDSWASTFGETVTALELSPDGTKYRTKTRFAKYFNIPELITLFKECADIQTPDMLNLPVPKCEFVDIVSEPSSEQKEFMKVFSDRADAIHNHQVDSSIDNMLKVTNDGRKLALDQRLLNPDLPDDPGSKINKVVENLHKIYNETNDEALTQIVFCDQSVSHGDGEFNVYDDIRDKLVAMGIPKSEIAFVQECKTDKEKSVLFEKVRKGEVRILMGSTSTMGTGTNVQTKLYALHHIDVPWRPADIEQQEGRILRQGNMNENVKIFRYITKGTFDAYSWQVIENKQKFIGQIMTSKAPSRSCEDLDETALSYAEVKALCLDNPLIKEKMELDIKVSKLKLVKSNYLSSKYQLEDRFKVQIPNSIKEKTVALERMDADVKAYNAQPKSTEEFSIEIKGRTYTDRKEAGEAFRKAVVGSIADNSNYLGAYKGFKIRARFDFTANRYQYALVGQTAHYGEVGDDPVGNMVRLENTLAAMDEARTKIENSLKDLQIQLDVAKKEFEKPFEQEDELNSSQERLNEVNRLLAISDKSDMVVEMDENESLTADDENLSESISEKAVGLNDKLKIAEKQVMDQEKTNGQNVDLGNDYP